jgi:hypothetical protein
MSDDQELRVRAVEHLLRILARCIDDKVLDDAAANLLAELAGELSAEDRALRQAALELLTNLDVARVGAARDAAGG